MTEVYSLWFWAFRRLLKCRVEPSMMTGGMITDADSTLGVEASQETFQEMCEGIVKEVGTAIYNVIIPAR